MTTLYDFEAVKLDGATEKLDAYSGKVALVVNTASKCGFTRSTTWSGKIYEALGPRGFVVLGFPCNQFGAQEPGDAEEIRNFCSLTYDVSFPMFA